MWKRQDDLIARLTIRGYLVLLTLAIMVPVLVFVAILYFGYYNSELARIETDLQYDARQLALTIDRDVAGLQYTAQTLSTATENTPSMPSTGVCPGRGDFALTLPGLADLPTMSGVRSMSTCMSAPLISILSVPCWGYASGCSQLVETCSNFTS